MIRLHGTSHVAGEELEGIRERIAGEEPGVVAVELDPKRLQALLTGESGKAGSPFLLLFKLLQDFLGSRTGVAPGSDMLEAFHAARRHGIDVALIDRDIAVTLQRVRDVPAREKIKFAGFLLLSPLVMRGREVDLVDEMLLRLEVGFPHLHSALVEERNRVMAERLKALESDYGDVLAFVGAGHVSGLETLLDLT